MHSCLGLNILTIFILQKRVIRIVNKAAYDAHTEPIFIEFGILPFRKIYLFHLGKFMFLYHKQMLPANFNNFFVVLIKFVIIIHEIRNCILFLSAELILNSFRLFIKELNCLIHSVKIFVMLLPFPLS